MSLFLPSNVASQSYQHTFILWSLKYFTCSKMKWDLIPTTFIVHSHQVQLINLTSYVGIIINKIMLKCVGWITTVNLIQFAAFF